MNYRVLGRSAFGRHYFVNLVLVGGVNDATNRNRFRAQRLKKGSNFWTLRLPDVKPPCYNSPDLRIRRFFCVPGYAGGTLGAQKSDDLTCSPATGSNMALPYAHRNSWCPQEQLGMGGGLRLRVLFGN